MAWHHLWSKRKAAPMKVAVEVANKLEAAAVRRAWQEPEVKAYVLIIGTLLQLPSDRSRLRVLKFVEDMVNEQSPQEAL